MYVPLCITTTTTTITETIRCQTSLTSTQQHSMLFWVSSLTPQAGSWEKQSWAVGSDNRNTKKKTNKYRNGYASLRHLHCVTGNREESRKGSHPFLTSMCAAPSESTGHRRAVPIRKHAQTHPQRQQQLRTATFSVLDFFRLQQLFTICCLLFAVYFSLSLSVSIILNG